MASPSQQVTTRPPRVATPERSTRLFLSPPHVGEAERERLLEAFDSNWIAPSGPHLNAFEADIERLLDNEVSAVALSSATAGLHLALRILGVGTGDRVLVPTLTFAATANPVRYCGAEPVFLDSEPTSWNLDPECLAEALADARADGAMPRAVISVDLYGQCANYARIRSLCDEYNLPLLQDSAEALGAFYRGQPAGLQGDLAVFSFNGNKLLTTGGGGVLVSRRSEWIERARSLASQAREEAPHYEHHELGYNYRMSNLLAAVGSAQLESLPLRIAARRKIFHTYRKALGDLSGVSFVPFGVTGEPNYWLTCLTIDPEEAGIDRETVRLALEAANIESRPLWKPMHEQPLYRGCRFLDRGVASRLFAQGLCLPSGSAMNEGDLARVIETIRSAFA